MCCVGVLDGASGGAGSSGERPPLPRMSSPDCLSASVHSVHPPNEPSRAPPRNFSPVSVETLWGTNEKDTRNLRPGWRELCEGPASAGG